jgi:hypothetical protein
LEIIANVQYNRRLVKSVVVQLGIEYFETLQIDFAEMDLLKWKELHDKVSFQKGSKTVC